MNGKYQIFVSSTFTDLRRERDLVIKAILEMGHIPVGMEMFSAADEAQWNVIKRNIDDSDYYVVVLANRRGSTATNDMSFTEKEYDYAIAQGIPVLGFVLDRAAPWPGDLCDTHPKDVRAQNAFKDKVRKRHVSFWHSGEDLFGKCSIALAKAFIMYPREGWTRASRVQGGKAENKAYPKLIQQWAAILRKNRCPLYVWLKGASEWQPAGQTTLLDLFNALGPELRTERSVEDIARLAAKSVCKISPSEFRWDFPMPSNLVKSWMEDFSALNLAVRADKKKNEYWTLTGHGQALLQHLRVARMKKLPRKSALEHDVATNGFDIGAWPTT